MSVRIVKEKSGALSPVSDRVAHSDGTRSAVFRNPYGEVISYKASIISAVSGNVLVGTQDREERCHDPPSNYEDKRDDARYKEKNVHATGFFFGCPSGI